MQWDMFFERAISSVTSVSNMDIGILIEILKNIKIVQMAVERGFVGFMENVKNLDADREE